MIIQPFKNNSKFAVSFTVATHNGLKEEYFKSGVFDDECLVLVDGGGKHPQFAASEVVDTVLLGYRLIRRKHFYYEAPHLLVEQLFIIAKRKLKKLSKTHPGLEARLTLLMVSSRFWWVATTSEIQAYVYKKEGIAGSLLRPKTDVPTLMQGKIDETCGILLLSSRLSGVISQKYLTDQGGGLWETGGMQRLVNRGIGRKKISSFSAAGCSINYEKVQSGVGF